jgi:hypothetical protein
MQVVEPNQHLFDVHSCKSLAEAPNPSDQAFQRSSVYVLENNAKELPALDGVDIFDDIAVVETL